MEQHYPFTLPPLLYGYDALAPELIEKVLYFHHDKHFAFIPPFIRVNNKNKIKILPRIIPFPHRHSSQVLWHALFTDV